MHIQNSTAGDIGLKPELVVPAMGKLALTEELTAELEKLREVPPVAAHFDAGRLVLFGDTEEVSEPAEMTDREAIIAGIMRGLPDDAMTKTGKPKLAPINDAMSKGADPVTEAERDAVWAMVDAEGGE